jgi:hypothetical protein
VQHFAFCRPENLFGDNQKERSCYFFNYRQLANIAWVQLSNFVLCMTLLRNSTDRETQDCVCCTATLQSYSAKNQGALMKIRTLSLAAAAATLSVAAHAQTVLTASSWVRFAGEKHLRQNEMQHLAPCRLSPSWYV